MKNQFFETKNDGYIITIPVESYSLCDFVVTNKRTPTKRESIEYVVTKANFEKLQAIDHEIVKVSVASYPSKQARSKLPLHIARQNRLRKEFPALGYWQRDENGERIRFIRLDKSIFILN